MGTRTRFEGGILREFDDAQQHETVFVNAPLLFAEDFIGAGHSSGIPSSGAPAVGYPWVKKIVGAAPPTVALITNAAGGVVTCALTSASEKQDAAIYWNDNFAVDMTKKAGFEIRAALQVTPNAAGVQMVLGFQSAWVDGPDAATFYLSFGCTANGNLIIRSKDGVTTSSIVAAPVGGAQIVLDTNYHIFRIDVTEPTDVGFYLDGVRVNAAGSIKFAATGSNAVLQPYTSVYKAAGAGVASLAIDKIDVWAGRI
jgi:hypothetical protein